MQSHAKRLKANLQQSEEEKVAVREELAEVQQKMAVLEADTRAAKGALSANLGFHPHFAGAY